MNFETFLKSLHGDTYPEPPSAIHDAITKQWLPVVTKLIPEGGVVLDAGCGQGVALEWLRDHGFAATGLTLNQTDLEVLRNRKLFAVFADMHDLCGLSGFDLVWARHVLEHSPAPLYVLKQFHRVLRDTGILYLEVPAPETACMHETNQNHYSVLGRRMWLCLLQKAGFKCMESSEMNFTTPAGPDIYWNFVCKKA